MSENYLQIWYSFARNQLQAAGNTCLYYNDKASESLALIETSGDEFSKSETVLENVRAVALRRKSIVTRIKRTVTENYELSEATGTDNISASVAKLFEPCILVSSPLIVDRELMGVVCFEFIRDASNQNHDYLAQVEATIHWLSSLSSLPFESNSKNPEVALKITACALSQSQSSEAAIAVASELATQINCDRVSIGFIEHNDVHVHAISNSTSTHARQNIIKCIESAMQEAVDQNESLVFPPEQTSYYRIQEHDILIRRHGGSYVCTVPMIVNSDVIGAVMYERHGDAEPFDQPDKQLCEQITSLFSPILYFRRLNDRPLRDKLKDSGRHLLSGFFGSSYLGAKFVVSLLAALLLTATLVDWEYRVSANAALEGTVERVITAPENGFIKDAPVRPGDIVFANNTLATLDDRDMQLEKLKWNSKLKQVSKEYREALAMHDLSQIGILRAQLAQAEAQLDILEQKLSRTVISAPIDGVIVSGDFTRSLGSPVERGQVLYKVSPLDSYRVILKVDEADVSDIKTGMNGELTLSAATEETFDMRIIKITPVSTSENNVNYFQVEAELQHTPDFLRPGMQGIGKIEVGQRQLIWIWTHKMVDWIRLKLWSWW